MTPESTGRTSPAPNASSEEPPRTRGGRRQLPPRSGRRPGDSGTKDQILVAALHLFASKGYTGTTIRGIADQAQVDPALVHHFFGNKEGVFRTAIQSTLSVSSIFDMMVEADSAERTEQPAAWLARAYLSFWEDETTGPAMVAIYRTGLADEAASALLRARLETSMANFAHHVRLVDGPNAEVTTALLSAQLAGLAVVRHILKVEPLASMDFEDFLAWATPALDLHFTAQAR